MQFDTFAALFDGLVHLARSRFRSLVVGYGIEIEDGGIVVFVGFADGFLTFVKRHLPVEVDVVLGLHLVVVACRPRVLLCGTRCHQPDETDQNRYVHPASSHPIILTEDLSRDWGRVRNP